MKRALVGLLGTLGAIVLVLLAITVVTWEQDQPPEPSPAVVAPSADPTPFDFTGGAWPAVDDLERTELAPGLARIASAIALTEPALRLFAATDPVLTADASTVSTSCRGAEIPLPEHRVLGCFASDGRGAGRISAYSVDHPELVGTNEVTLAHELLHAVWNRMSGDDRSRLEGPLETVFAEGHPSGRIELLEAYRESNRETYLNELHSYIGTEVRELPLELEEHYASVFRDRQAVVEFSERAGGSLRSREAELDARRAELAEQDAWIAAENESLRQLSEAREAEAAELSARLPQVDASDPAAVEEYNDRVQRHNAALDADELRRSELRAAIDAYNAAVAERARLVDELNALYDELGVELS